jgi:transcriptional regulator with XRE-family HTH domain
VSVNAPPSGVPRASEHRDLRRLWHAKGISQEDLAHEAGINRSYMSKVEKGASYPGLEIVAKLATVLAVEPAELIRTPVQREKPGA